MALDYHYELGTPETPRHVAEVLLAAGHRADLIDRSVTVDQVLQGWTTTHWTWFRVRDGRTAFPWNVVEESFGFAPTVTVAFRLQGDHPTYLQQDDLIRLVAALLEAVPGDAVLMFDASDDAWLLRRDGDLAVSADDDRWPARRLALLPGPYRRATYSLT